MNISYEALRYEREIFDGSLAKCRICQYSPINMLRNTVFGKVVLNTFGRLNIGEYHMHAYIYLYARILLADKY